MRGEIFRLTHRFTRPILANYYCATKERPARGAFGKRGDGGRSNAGGCACQIFEDEKGMR